MKQYSPGELQTIADNLNCWELLPAGTEGYKKAEVTAGGVSTDELSSQTMETRRMPGLYFIGEVVDVTGQLGGYNFQWAWSSGFAAGQSV
jgi:predicted flavoprotein YhiN